MQVAAIVVNYNDVETTLAQIERLEALPSIAKVIVVDNNSSDDSRVRLKARACERVIFIQAKRNGGYGYGNNIGLYYAQENHFDMALIANPDTYISEDVLKKMCVILKKNKKLALIAPKMKLPGIENRPGSKENIVHGAPAFPIRPWLFDLLEAGPITRRVFRKILHYPSSYFEGKHGVYVDALPGSLLLVKVDAVLKSGGYDENVFLYEEETILGKRLKDHGYRSMLYLDGSYLHRHSVSISKSFGKNGKRQKIRKQSTLYYYEKYLHIPKWQRLLSVLFFKVVDLETMVLDFVEDIKW